MWSRIFSFTQWRSLPSNPDLSNTRTAASCPSSSTRVCDPRKNIVRSAVLNDMKIMDAAAITDQEVRRWDAAKLVDWIQQVLDPPLRSDDRKKILKADIDGSVFLEGAGDKASLCLLVSLSVAV
jgi:hypothetical protein